MVVEELVALLGFKFDDKDLKTFNEGVKTATKTIAAVGAAAVGAASGVFLFAKSVASTSDELGKTSQALGIATEELQGWILAAELGGASQNALVSSMQNLGRRTSEAARGIGAGVEVFGLLGISATESNGQIKESSAILEEVADRVSQLSTQAEKLELLEKLGISASLLLTLDRGSEAIRRQRQEVEQLGFALDEEATKNAAAFKDELLRVTKIAGGVTTALGQGILPALTEILETFKLWFLSNKELIRQNIANFLNGVVDVLRTTFNIARRVANVFDALAQAIGGWTNVLGIAGAALLAFNAKALLVPVLIAGVATAIFLLVEDIVTFFQGGESAIESFVDNLSDKIDTIKQLLNAVISPFKEIFAFIGFGETEFNGPEIPALQREQAATIPSSSLGAFGNIGNLAAAPAERLASSNTSISSNNRIDATININGTNSDPKEIALNVREEIGNVLNDVLLQTDRDVSSPIKR